MYLSNPNDLPVLDKVLQALVAADFAGVTESWSNVGLSVNVENEARRREFEALVREHDPLAMPGRTQT
jgi:hypothetical protein